MRNKILKSQAMNIFYILVLYLAVVGCSTNTDGKIVAIQGQTMGTTYSVQIVKSEDVRISNDLSNEINEILHRIDSLMSTWRADSELMQINMLPSEQWIKVSPETLYVINMAQDISANTQGAFDITLEPLIELWGFSARHANDIVPELNEINIAKSQTGYKHLFIEMDKGSIKKKIPLELNLSAIAKGYAVDKIAEHLVSRDYKAFLVEVGGEIRAHGRKPGGSNWKIAIESPYTNIRKSHQIVTISNKALATSGDYRNYFEKNGKRYSHTINPATGYPITHKLASVTVINDSAARADALATALMVMGPEKGFRFCVRNAIPAYFIFKQGDGFQTQYTDLFKSYLDNT